MKNRILLVALALLLPAMSLVAVGCPPPEPVDPVVRPPPVEVIEWRMQTLWDAGTLFYDIFVDFTARVYELSGGRLRITPFPPGGIVPTFEKFDALRLGVFDAMQTFETYWAGIEPAMVPLSSVPLGFTDRYQYEAWFWEGGGVELAREIYARFNIYYIGPVIYGPEFQHMRAGHPVRTFEDYRGKSMRFPGGIQADIMSAAGVSVVVLPGGEVYPALAKGLLDGADFASLAVNYDLGWHEITKWIIKPGFHQPTTNTGISANMDSWKALPPDLQAILEAAVREFSEEKFARNLVAQGEALERMLAAGNEVIVLPEAEIEKFRAVAQPLWEKWAAKSPMARRVWDSYLDFMRHLGLLE
ncbi:MAG: Lactate-binding periplasmic protein [Syntrophomonadaceae bacterium]|nr:Lactate-binding periplasmic protein [Bacillota bacterium]MBT9146829.1 Lactate-binding periplasmic protein [Bacillota bacterium]